MYSRLKSGSYTLTPFFTKAIHIICGQTRNTRVNITEKIIPTIESALDGKQIEPILLWTT